MKNVSAIFLSCFLMTGVTTSATMAQNPLSFGIKGGVNIADFAGTDYETDGRTGGMVGASLDLNIPASPISIETGLYYSQKGTKLTETDPELGETTLTYRIDYLEIPLLAKWNLGTPGMVRPHLFAGPYVSFNMVSETDVTFDGVTVTDDFTGFTRETDTGLLVGAGSHFHIGVALLSLQLRYGLGITQVFDDDFEGGENNSVLNITFGYHF